ncbi:hypothetical protein H0H81_001708 [Sphagnurus paluster]|uniref:Uncharacterized protein n=1 Tax=Sphagnurus paluster TaxID=117069 RepID=A0A9P7FNW6_9AGAR|nr:hypothetical protein H0H81_001708 [Sphagnurus paluster]
MSVIEAAFHDPLAHHLHLSPFKLFHFPPIIGKEERVLGEVYTSNAFLEEHDLFQRRSPVPLDDTNCKREKVVAAIMFSSDGTHLTNFGMAKAWPIYLMLGNLSKYLQSPPNTGVMHHLAYIPLLPDSFQDVASKVHDKWKTQQKAITTHCRRELMNAVWEFLLDDDFIHAYKYGMVIKCTDGIEHHVYPRLFTYSADYPEKLIYDLAHSITITGARVEELLKDISAVPTLNTFFKRLSTKDKPFNPAKMLVVDLLHEFELGVWQTVFKHLIRLLYAESPHGELVAELDSQFVLLLPQFANNASEMKKMAARDFEDLLQCSIPAFEDLLPEPHNKRLMKLLYRTAEWHALAKAWMHTESSPDLLEALTVKFGKLVREFRDLTCSVYKTVELPRETTAPMHRAQASQSGPTNPAVPTSNANNPSMSTPVPQPNPSAAAKKSCAVDSSHRTKTLNLQLYKLHAMGDYVSCIRMFGTTDSYSTQLGELAHCLIKTLYG